MVEEKKESRVGKAKVSAKIEGARTKKQQNQINIQKNLKTFNSVEVHKDEGFNQGAFGRWQVEGKKV